MTAKPPRFVTSGSNAAERHMLYVWWVRVVAMVTGWDEDTVAVIANYESRRRDTQVAAAGALSWLAWFPEETP